MEDENDIEMSLDGGTSKRACDSCRTRKIRCDRTVPCSNCKASKLTCTTTPPAQKAQRQRVHISEEYEKKIDRIEDRLSGIEQVLASLASKLSNLDLQKDSPSNSGHSRSSRTGQGKSPVTATDPATPAPFEGETAINIQSDYARELVAQAIGSNPSIGQNAEVKSTLHALNELVMRQSHFSAPNASADQPLINRSLADIDPEKLERPPWEEVKNVLDKAALFPTMAFAVIFPFFKMDKLQEVFEDAHHNPGNCAASRRMLAYGVMHSLFREFSTTPLSGMNVEAFEIYIRQCKIHMEVAMSQLDIFLPPNYENIMALLLGTACAVEMSKPSLAWVMITSAAGLCQNLGYHRYQTMKNDSPEERSTKIHIFWMVYMFDKTMSLRLGRSSVIQDWDISLPFVLADDQGPQQSLNGKQMLMYWVTIARIQGQTYEKLFSPAALLRSPEDRTRTAVELVNAMNQAWYDRGNASAADASSVTETGLPNIHLHTHANHSPNETAVPSKRKRVVPLYQLFGLSIEANEYMKASLERAEDVFFHSDVVMHYSTCALIQRAVSPDNVTFNQECLESARAALVAHQRCNTQFNTKENAQLWSGYVHWSILQAPFTPFIVIFCSAIQNTDLTDLESLQVFVSSLESCRTISEGADKLYKMCHLFLHVAKLYIQAKKQDSTAQTAAYTNAQPNYSTTTDGTQFDLNTMTQFDPYLSALGLMPNTAWPMANFADPAAPIAGMDQFSSVQSMSDANNIEMAGIGLPSGTQKPVQDWFSGSRYLMNMMEAGDDLQMPDFEI